MWYEVVETLDVGPVHIRVWGLLVGLGIVSGIVLTAHLARRRDLRGLHVFSLGLVVTWAGVIGSKAVWALQPALIGGTVAQPRRLLAFWEPGLTLVGGLLAAFAAGIWFVRRSGASPLAVADLVAPGFGLGLAVGRVGCFLTGLHPGRPTDLPWGIHYLGALRHPIPLYESLLGVAILGVGLLLFVRRPPRGLTALTALLIYIVGRSLLDLLRAPGVAGADPRLFGEVTLTQGLALPLGAAAIGTAVAMLLRRQPRPTAGS